MPKKRVIQEKDSVFEVRPIGARALKSAIDTLRPHLNEAELLDLYAGQGRFGIAASDEGLSSVTFVEKDRTAAQELRGFLKSPRFPKNVETQVIVQDVLAFLAQCQTKYDLIFADPPFPLWNESFEKMLFQAVAKVLKPSSIFLVKHPSRMVPCSEIEPFKLMKTTEFGESRLIYFSYEAT